MKNSKIYSIGFTLILFLIVLTPRATSNPLKYEWNRILGGILYDTGLGVAVDSSDNVYLGGFAGNFGVGGGDMILAKYDGNGVLQWNRTWGGINSDHSEGVVYYSGYVYSAGCTSSFGEGGEADMVLVKYDENGVQQWNRTWGGPNSDGCFGVAVDSLGNVYLIGGTDSFGVGLDDIVLVKYNNNGVQQWNRTWGGVEDDRGLGITVDTSGNLYLVGNTESFGAGLYDMILVKYNANGVQQWNRTWGGTEDDFGNGIVADSSGNVYLMGSTESFGAGLDDMVLVKYDPNGVQQWNRTRGAQYYEWGNGVAVDSSDNIYITGTVYCSDTTSYGIALVKYNANGVEQWHRIWDGDNTDKGNGIALDSSGNAFIVGETHSFETVNGDIVLVKFGPESEEAIPGYNVITFISVSLLIVLISGYFIRKKSK